MAPANSKIAATMQACQSVIVLAPTPAIGSSKSSKAVILLVIKTGRALGLALGDQTTGTEPDLLVPKAFATWTKTQET
jgi:hypothetical protein